jgi:hypothetical protein
MILEDTKTTAYLAHTFNVADVEDPDLWAAMSLGEWEESPAGKWAMKNTNPTPSWHRISHNYTWQYQIKIYLTPKQLTYYKLRFE